MFAPELLPDCVCRIGSRIFLIPISGQINSKTVMALRHIRKGRQYVKKEWHAYQAE